MVGLGKMALSRLLTRTFFPDGFLHSGPRISCLGRRALEGGGPHRRATCGSVMIFPQRRNAVLRKLTPGVLLLALAASYVLVWVHILYVHESVFSEDQCAVCSWAKSFGNAAPAVPAVLAAFLCARLVTPSFLAFRPFCCRLPFSARSPPATV